MEKRKPGRPPSESSQINIPRLGIIEDKDKKLIVQLKFYIPTIFSKIFELMKTNMIEDIIIIFEKKNVIICGIGHRKTIIKTEIDCNKVHSYFCNEKVIIRLGRTNIDKLIKKIDAKYHDMIIFEIGKYEDIIKSCLNIIIVGKNVDSTNQVNIEIIDKVDFIDNENWDEKTYDISILFDHSIIKKCINDMKKISNDMKITVEYLEGKNIFFKYSSECNIVSSSEEFKIGEKINLINNKKIPIVISKYLVSNLWATTNLQLNSSIMLNINNDSKLMILANLDKAIVIKAIVPMEI